MNVIGVTHWARRDRADRRVLGQTAYDLCKALTASDDISDSRFYWNGPDTVVLQVFAKNAEALVHPPNADAARAMFELADLAERVRFEEWMGPRTGMAVYEMAGR
jgi:hypothetical protein